MSDQTKIPICHLTGTMFAKDREQLKYEVQVLIAKQQVPKDRSKPCYQPRPDRTHWLIGQYRVLPSLGPLWPAEL